MTGLKLSALRYLGVAKEASYGTPATTGIRWLPMRNPSTEEEIKYAIDNGLRGVAAEEFGAYQGVENYSFSYELDFYVTDTPLLLTNILGPDTKTGTAAPYTHTFNLAAAEPASLTLHDFDGIDELYSAGSYLSQVGFKLDSEGALTASIQGKGFPPVSESTSVPSYAAEPYFLGWETALTLNGSGNTRLVTMEINLSRTLTPRWTANNTQSPKFIFVGPLKVDWKATFDVEDDTEWNYFVNNTQPSFSAKLTQPGSSNAITFQMSKCAFTKAPKTSSKDWIQVDAAGSALYNTTDQGPIAIIVQNTQSTAY